MSRAFATWQLLSDSLRQGIPAMLLYVVHSEGSSPGRAGFGMAVDAHGAMQGSIGGGIMEHKLVQLALERLQQPVTAAPTLHRQVHNKTATRDQSGMICSGEQTVLLYPVQPADAEPMQRLLLALQQEQPGTLSLAPAGIGFLEHIFLVSNYKLQKVSDTDWLYQERIGYKNQLHIIGGGHCALALSRLLRPLDFQVQLYEDRPELNTFLANDYTHGKTVVDTYADVASLIPEGANQYVVVMTFGYRTDDLAVRALLGRQLRFLGVLGSGKKIEKLLGDYRADGIPEQQLARLHAPVGLPINSQTPEEIAISIAAQLIAVKNGQP